MPFKVRLVDGLADTGVWADCGERKGHFFIRMDKALALDYPEVASIILLHELAHCHTFTEDEDHGDAFWLAYGRLYRLWMVEK